MPTLHTQQSDDVFDIARTASEHLQGHEIRHLDHRYFDIVDVERHGACQEFLFESGRRQDDIDRESCGPMNEGDDSAPFDERVIGETLLESIGFDRLDPRGGRDFSRRPHRHIDVGREPRNAVDDSRLGAKQIPRCANGRERMREVGEEISDG